MRGMRIAPVGLTLMAALVAPAVLYADVIHLKNGRTLQVEAWRDAGDAIEFAMGGGVIRIAKAEVEKIDGKPSRGDFRMYTSGVSASPSPVDEQALVSQMADLLKQGEALFGQTALSASEKAGAFRRLGERWRGFDVTEPLRSMHARGEAALRMAADAFGGDQDLPDTKERVEKAKAELAGVQDEVKKRAGGQG